MIQLNEAPIESVALHRVGNKVHDEGYTAAEALYPWMNNYKLSYRDFFLRPFKNEELFKFTHPYRSLSQ